MRSRMNSIFCQPRVPWDRGRVVFPSSPYQRGTAASQSDGYTGLGIGKLASCACEYVGVSRIAGATACTSGGATSRGGRMAQMGVSYNASTQLGGTYHG